MRRIEEIGKRGRTGFEDPESAVDAIL